MRKISCVLVLLLAVILMCAWTPSPNNLQMTINFGTGYETVSQSDIQNGWYNYEDYKKNEDSSAVQKRAIMTYIDKIVPKYETKVYDGTVNFYPHRSPRFTVTNQSNGRKINREKLCDDIYNKKRDIIAEYITVLPKYKTEILNGIVKRGTARTTFEHNPPREHNIALSIGAFNGLVVDAGEAISFNSVVGRRTTARGYRESKIIIDGEYVPGVGGGVCQSSTTLFNALVDAGLHITESHNHTLPSTYVPLGKDAMVSSGSDLRFVNNSGMPIYFETGVSNQTVYVNIYGRTKGGDIRYRLSTNITKEYPPTEIPDADMPKTLMANYKKSPNLYDKKITENGHKGYAVTTYIEIYKGDRLVSRKLLRRSVYKSRPTKYAIVSKTVDLQQDKDI